jgi:hypothetical protein
MTKKTPKCKKKKTPKRKKRMKNIYVNGVLNFE